jgi:hypothetical protein
MAVIARHKTPAWMFLYMAFDELGIAACFHTPDGPLTTRGPPDGPRSPVLQAIVTVDADGEVSTQRAVPCSALQWKDPRGKTLRRLPKKIADEIDRKWPIGARTGSTGKVTVEYISRPRKVVKKEVFCYVNPSEDADQEKEFSFVIRINTELAD